MKKFTILPLASMFIFSCTPPESETDCDDCNEKIHIASIYPQDSIAFVEPGYEDTALMSEYFFTEGDQVFFDGSGAGNLESTWPVSLETGIALNNINVVYDPKAPGPIKIGEGLLPKSNPFDSIITYVAYRMYAKADCNRTLPGFVVGCIATIGKHKQVAPFMQWTVNTHKKCGNGKGICVETMQDIGDIFYHQMPGCTDSTFLSADILEYACP